MSEEHQWEMNGITPVEFVHNRFLGDIYTTFNLIYFYKTISYKLWQPLLTKEFIPLEILYKNYYCNSMI